MDLITAVGGEQAFEMIVDLAVKEAVHLILSSKCCLWSRRKHNRCLKSRGWVSPCGDCAGIAAAGDKMPGTDIIVLSSLSRPIGKSLVPKFKTFAGRGTPSPGNAQIL